MDIVVAGIGILLALVIGFAVHRASLCNVMAVAEVPSSRRAHMLESFLKSVLWVVAATAVIELLFFSESTQVATHWGFSGRALAGGFVFEHDAVESLVPGEPAENLEPEAVAIHLGHLLGVVGGAGDTQVVLHRVIWRRSILDFVWWNISRFYLIVEPVAPGICYPKRRECSRVDIAAEGMVRFV